MKTALLYDHGLSPFVATKLAEEFRVLYYSPYEADAFPVSRKKLWGTLPGVERISDFFAAVAEADFVVFPDHGAGDLQVYLKKQGVPVWGSGIAESLELDRIRFRKLQQALGMPAPKSHVLYGLDELKDHLERKENEHQYIKLSEWRGDLETYHHQSWWLSETWLKDLDHRLGPMRDRLVFLAEEAVDDAVEVGFDGLFIVNGFASPCVYGYEIKDIAYVGKVVDYDDLPPVILKSNSDLAPTLRAMDPRSFVSTELRVTEDGTGYLIDPCLRIPSPPGGALLEVYSNWPAVIEAGAHGKRLPPKPKAKYCAELVLRSDFAVDDFMAIDIPKAYRDYVKLHGHAQVDGVDYVVAIGMDVIGGAVGIGDTVDEACEMATEVAKSLKGYMLEVPEEGFDIARETIEKGEKSGIEF